VALQPLGGHRADWEQLADVIEAAPSTWRWWIRRHPASRSDQDSEYGRLVTLQGSNVEIIRALALPLPLLLKRMDAVLSLASGTAVEASMFGVPAFFLSEEARGPFGALIASGRATVINIPEITRHIASLGERKPHRPEDLPALDETLAQLEEMAAEYAHDHRGSCDRVNIRATRCEGKDEPV